MTPDRPGVATRHGLGVQRGLLLGGGERPGGARAPLLAEHEAQLLRRFQLGLVGTEGRARLLELERAQEVDPEEALSQLTLLAARWARACFAACHVQLLPPLHEVRTGSGRQRS